MPTTKTTGREGLSGCLHCPSATQWCVEGSTQAGQQRRGEEAKVCGLKGRLVPSAAKQAG